MHRSIFASLSALALTAAPALAQPDQPAKPVTDRDPDAVDVAATPMTDLNLRKDQIPQLLIDAEVKPYDLNGLGKCSQLAARIGEFDAVLGDDLDLPQSPGQRLSPGRIGQYVVGSFIPFRGLIREVSGANDQRRRMDAAISAGLARRGFLKGIGQERGCRYPARSATREVWDQYVEAAKQAKAEKQRKDSDSAQEVADARGK
jgi:hypothetical protein